MKLKVHYITDEEGSKQAAKIDIKDWDYIRKLLEEKAVEKKEDFEIIETPVEVKKLETKTKRRAFSDFIMDI